MNHTIPLCLRRGMSVALLVIGCGIAAPSQTTLTALSAGAATPFPNSPSYDFEYSAVGTNQYLYGFQFPGGNPSAWTPWTMNTASGIAAEGSGFVGSQNTPSGTRVVFLQNTGSITLQHTFGRGHWRLRFVSAQRANFGTSHQSVKVTVAGTEVFESEPIDTTFRTYMTRPFTFLLATTATVTIAGTNTAGDHTAFVDAIELEPLSDWNDATKWSPAQVPTASDDVVIPDQVEMVLRGNEAAATVTANGELLTTFQDATLDTRWVAVSGVNSRFEVGQERTPFAQNFTLTLLGSNPTENVMNSGSAFLMAMDGGTVDMHGVDKKSWTKLNSLASVSGQPTKRELTVDDHTSWAVGDEIVVAYTGHVSFAAGWGAPCVSNPYMAPKSEKVVIDAIDPITGAITVIGTLPSANHCTAPPVGYTGPNHPAGWVLDQRAEVGMLTRNVRIRGDATTPSFGGHVMIMACCTAMPVGLGRFANVELSNMGQKQKLGRYPMHWHMLRDVRPGNYLRNSSVHACHNRGVTVHGSHEVVVERNVVFDTEGHAMFLEDGVEEDNHFLNNLVLATRKPAACQQMLPHDNSLDQAQNHAPATFWISNPNNHFVGNVAADSLGVGYWFALHTFPTGLSSTVAWSGQFTGSFAGLTETLGTFADNVAHSIKMGVDVHDAVRDGDGAKVPQPACNPGTVTYCGAPWVGPTVSDPTDDDILTNAQWRPTTQAVLTGFTAYGCTTGLYSGGGIDFTEQVRFDDCVLADNGVHVQFASADTVSNSLFVYDSGHVIYPTGTGPGGNGLADNYIAGFEDGSGYVVYDGPGRVRDSHFVGYDGSTDSTLVFGFFGAARRHVNHVFDGLSFDGTGTPPILPLVALPDYTSYATTSPFAHSFVWGIVIRDEDGSLSGGIPSNPNSPYPAGTPHSLVTNHPMVHLTNASGTADVLIGTNAWLSPFPWGHLQVRYYEAAGTFNPATGCYSQYVLQQVNDIPSARFVRRGYLGWARTAYLSDSLPGSQMRQTPVIVSTAGSSVAVCEYEVRLDPFMNPTQSAPGRADISLDDAVAGDRVRLVITHSGLPTTWTPALRINDAAAQIHINGQDPNILTPMTPSAPGSTTTYQMTTLSGAPAIDLHLVVPPTQRTHRITITW
jgi:cell surface hyaluronidase